MLVVAIGVDGLGADHWGEMTGVTGSSTQEVRTHVHEVVGMRYLRRRQSRGNGGACWRPRRRRPWWWPGGEVAGISRRKRRGLTGLRVSAFFVPRLFFSGLGHMICWCIRTLGYFRPICVKFYASDLYGPFFVNVAFIAHKNFVLSHSKKNYVLSYPSKRWLALLVTINRP